MDKLGLVDLLIEDFKTMVPDSDLATRQALRERLLMLTIEELRILANQTKNKIGDN